MGKLFDADSGKKEGAKQDSWLEAVTKTLAEYNGPLKPLVEKLAMYDNIPRKQKAFENFVANSLNLKRDIVTVSKLWNIVEPCLKEKSQAGDTNGKSPKPWRSYEEETEELLRANGGSMPWKLLQAHLTKRRRTVFPQENLDEIKLKVLANIPVQFLSESSKNVSV
jgi:cell growth-regulating nucleolar protein